MSRTLHALVKRMHQTCELFGFAARLRDVSHSASPEPFSVGRTRATRFLKRLSES